MSSTVIIELKTAAPEVAWGEPDVAEAGLELSVPYISSEVVRAELWLADGRVLEMDVQPDSLVVLLPDDVWEGLHTIYAYDDVGNPAPHALHITGIVPVEPTRPTTGGMPTLEPTVIPHRSSVRFTSRTVIGSRRTGRTPITPTSRTMRRRELLSHRSSVLLTSRWSLAATSRSGQTAVAAQALTAIERRRPEEPGSDDGLVIFGLL